MATTTLKDEELPSIHTPANAIASIVAYSNSTSHVFQMLPTCSWGSGNHQKVHNLLFGFCPMTDNNYIRFGFLSVTDSIQTYIAEC